MPVVALRQPYKKFQSTHPRGVRLINFKWYIHYNRFQSTHPRGVRRLVGDMFPAVGGFNPRTHAGCDRNQLIIITILRVSIHAPTRGATRYCVNGYPRLTVSIHAPTRGATNIYSSSFIPPVFQSTHPRGV